MSKARNPLSFLLRSLPSKSAVLRPLDGPWPAGNKRRLSSCSRHSGSSRPALFRGEDSSAFWKRPDQDEPPEDSPPAPGQKPCSCHSWFSCYLEGHKFEALSNQKSSQTILSPTDRRIFSITAQPRSN